MTLFTTAQAASYLGISQQTVSRLAKNGNLQFELIGARKAFPLESLEAYTESNNLTQAPSDHVAIQENKEEITAVSFFSGALGLDLGMEKAGIHSSLYCENDIKCRMTINSNRPAPALLGDINSLTAEDIFKYSKISPARGIDVMFGGPPCQAFSTAGARRAFDDARGNVFLKYLELADTIRPKYLVIENVRGLLSTAYPLVKGGEPQHGGAMAMVLKRLKKMGYTASFNLYNAANFGAPQIRERVVIIAKREGSPVKWLTPTHSQDPSWGLPNWETFKDATKSLGTECHYIQFPEKRLKYFTYLSEGQYWRNLPKDLQEEAMGKAYKLSGGKTGFYRRIWFDRPCPTLVTSPTMPATDLCHPTEERPLSIEEYKAVQGFPKSWVFRGDLSDIYKQIGNAVPIALGEAIGKAILNDMNGIQSEDTTDYSTFPYSRYKHTSDKTWSMPTTD